MKLFYLVCFTILFSPSLLIGQCEPSAQTFLDANNVKANLVQGGGLWYNGSEGKYIVPKNAVEEVSSILAGGLWIGGYESGDLKLAASKYDIGNGIFDFRVGPLAENGDADLDNCQNWDRFFEVYDTDILTHIADYDDNGQIDDTPSSNILGWPGMGNPSFFDIHGFDLPISSNGFAPFVDLNNNGFYEPMLGDYPEINNATQAVWWVFNDASGMHYVSQGDPLKVEIQMMAFSYNSINEDVNNSTFYNVKMIYKGQETLNDVRVALWVDPNLGCFDDDFVGCSPEANLAYVYNEDAFDGLPGCSCDQGVTTYCEEIPVTGFKLVKGLISDDQQEMDMSSFIAYVDPTVISPPANQLGPQSPMEYYNLLQGLWRDSTMILNDNGIATPFYYSGNPSATDEWSSCTTTAPINIDRRMVIGFGSYTMQPGTSNDFTFAVVTKLNVAHPCPDITVLEEASEEVANFYCGLVSNEPEPIANHSFVSIHPNPFKEMAILDLNDEVDQLSKVSIYSLDGKLVNDYQNISGTTLTLNKENIGSGMFLYKIKTKSGYLRTGKFVIK